MYMALLGCVNYRNINSDKKIAEPAEFATQHSLPRQNGRWTTVNWARQFGDPQLTSLIQEALQHNPDIQAATARIKEARAIAEDKAAALSPTVKWDGFGGIGGFSTNAQVPTLFDGSSFTQGAFLFNLNYTLDFWGKNTANYKQALATAKATQAAREEASLSIATAIATTYNQLAFYYDLSDVLKRTVSQRKTLDEIALARLRTGLDTKVQVYQSRNTLASARTQLINTQGQIRLTKQQLGTLLGKGPDRGLTIQRPQLHSTNTPRLPKNLPLNLLGRRPDIVKARWQVEATCHGIKHVKAQFYPNVNLLAGGGLLAVALNHFSLNASTEYLGPAITLPIFDAGALRAQLREQYGYYEEAVANYNTTLNNALSDVANQLTAIKFIDKQLLSEQIALDTAKHAYDLARQQYRIGLASQLVVLNAESQFLNEQQSYLQLVTNRRNLQIALIKSLGGGFDKHMLTAETCKKSEKTNNEPHR